MIGPLQTGLDEAQRVRELLVRVIEQREMIARDDTLSLDSEWNSRTGFAVGIHGSRILTRV